MTQDMPQSASLWQKRPTQRFPQLQEDVTTKVCVIGGGIAGVTTAYMLARKGIPSVLIEAGEIGTGTTGHTTAKISSQHGLKYADLWQSIGAEKTKLYYEANEDAISWVERTCRRLAIDCSFSRRPAYLYATSEEGKTRLEREAEAYRSLHLDGSLTDKHELPFAVTAALKMHEQAQFHPVCFLAKLLRYLEVEQMPVFEQTRAVDVKRGRQPVVTTDGGRQIKADHVVMATHYPFKDLQSLFAARLHVERSYAIAFRLHGEVPKGMYLHAESPVQSFREAEDIDGRPLLLGGGFGHTSGQAGNTESHYEKLRDFVTSHFDVKAIPYRWSSQDIHTSDGVPYAGPLTPGSEDVYVLTGFGKWGMSAGVAAAQVTADRLEGKYNPYASLFTPSRFHPRADMKQMVKENMDTARAFVRGKFHRTKGTVDDLDFDEGAVLKVNGSRTAVYKDENGEISAVDSSCTHLGCELGWNQAERSWDCPCHGSRFDVDGSVLEGPAVHPLKKREDV
ncbi:FAD-dependent oxidoreductase [Alkalicoccus chagannorensis]|uniref:FAD-dependent oxidoreductase n=1 Tax=Alkalicoccus chagannorensis TaxID=427072 RepID=UPI00040F3D36|nr:FAD-dependent oxidoreductase [Alkalicoccus chagannorensis]